MWLFKPRDLTIHQKSDAFEHVRYFQIVVLVIGSQYAERCCGQNDFSDWTVYLGEVSDSGFHGSAGVICSKRWTQSTHAKGKEQSSYHQPVHS